MEVTHASVGEQEHPGALIPGLLCQQTFIRLLQ